MIDTTRTDPDDGVDSVRYLAQHCFSASAGAIAHAVRVAVGMACAVECGTIEPGVAGVRVLAPLRWFLGLGVVHLIARRRAWPAIHETKPAYVRMRLSFGVRRRPQDGRLVW